ncbi:tRNA synthetase-related [Actinidia rufa]|uniref:tRNA synthetase-related n=1 Tax=Actinidia rufa TaxID=165716 RepID=A0A7J0D9S4_9ERIC|nr:tRNA synthetase-related [Actinidia rufa]
MAGSSLIRLSMTLFWGDGDCGGGCEEDDGVGRGGTLCFASGKPAKKWTYWGRSY